ncbi:MAG: hypothetical protein OCD02_10335 [Spirochaetaceae bacterium]
MGNIVSKYKIQQRISLLYIIIGILTICLNIVAGIITRKMSFIEIISSITVYPVIFFVVFFILTFNKTYYIIKIFHIVPLLLYSTAAILVLYNSFYGLNLYIIMTLLLYKYNFFKRKIIIKSLLTIIYIFSIIEISILRDKSLSETDLLSVFIFLCFFILFLFILFKDEFFKIIQNDKKLKSEIVFLNQQKIDLKQQMLELSEELKNNDDKIKLYYSNSINLDDFDFTIREYSLIEYFCEKNSTNKELAFHFNVSVPSIKQHFNNIFKKVGIYRRIELLEACKPYFHSKNIE